MFCKKITRDKVRDAALNVAHEAQDAATIHYEAVREKVGEKAQDAGERLHDWKGSVTDAATSAWGTLAHKAGELTQELAQRAADAAHKAGEAAHERFDEPAHIASRRAAEAVESARERFGEVKHQAADAASQAPVFLQSAAQSAAVKAGTVGVKAGKALHDRAAQYVPDYNAEIKVIDKKADFTTKLLWLGVGVFAGVALGILLAPNSGRRSRALVRDKLAKAGHEAGDLGNAAKKKAEDISNRASGLAHDLKERVHPAADMVEDSVIEARVRSALGHNAALSHLEGLNLDVADGVVTLRGPLADDATRAALEATVRTVAGVRDVKNTLLTDSAEEEQAFVG